jgi:multimeric flavodoxin WrbA
MTAGERMKILNVYGSFINGSSAAIANRFIEKAARPGTEIQTVNFSGKTINRCKKCLSCKTVSDKCVIRDDLMPVFEALAQCDVLVLSTGVYEGDVAGNMCIIESRLFSLLKPDHETNPDPSRLPPGKKLVFIQTQEASKDWHTNIYERYEALFRKLGFVEVYVIHADYIAIPLDIKVRPDILNLVDEIAGKIHGG